MQGFGIHSSIWTMRWTPDATEFAMGEGSPFLRGNTG
jgi:hypothetical protein